MRAAIVMTTRLKLAQKTFETQHIYKSDEELRFRHWGEGPKN